MNHSSVCLTNETHSQVVFPETLNVRTSVNGSLCALVTMSYSFVVSPTLSDAPQTTWTFLYSVHNKLDVGLVNCSAEMGCDSDVLATVTCDFCETTDDENRDDPSHFLMPLGTLNGCTRVRVNLDLSLLLHDGALTIPPCCFPPGCAVDIWGEVRSQMPFDIRSPSHPFTLRAYRSDLSADGGRVCFSLVFKVLDPSTTTPRRTPQPPPAFVVVVDCPGTEPQCLLELNKAAGTLATWVSLPHPGSVCGPSPAPPPTSTSRPILAVLVDMPPGGQPPPGYLLRVRQFLEALFGVLVESELAVLPRFNIATTCAGGAVSPADCGQARDGRQVQALYAKPYPLNQAQTRLAALQFVDRLRNPALRASSPSSASLPVGSSLEDWLAAHDALIELHWASSRPAAALPVVPVPGAADGGATLGYVSLAVESSGDDEPPPGGWTIPDRCSPSLLREWATRALARILPDFAMVELVSVEWCLLGTDPPPSAAHPAARPAGMTWPAPRDVQADPECPRDRVEHPTLTMISTRCGGGPSVTPQGRPLSCCALVGGLPAGVGEPELRKTRHLMKITKEDQTLVIPVPLERATFLPPGSTLLHNLVARRLVEQIETIHGLHDLASGAPRLSLGSVCDREEPGEEEASGEMRFTRVTPLPACRLGLSRHLPLPPPTATSIINSGPTALPRKRPPEAALPARPTPTGQGIQQPSAADRLAQPHPGEISRLVAEAAQTSLELGIEAPAEAALTRLGGPPTVLALPLPAALHRVVLVTQDPGWADDASLPPHAILLLFDVTRRATIDQLAPWLARLEQAPPRPVTVLVGTRADAAPSARQVVWEEAVALANVHHCDYVECGMPAAGAATHTNCGPIWLLVARRLAARHRTPPNTVLGPCRVCLLGGPGVGRRTLWRCGHAHFGSGGSSSMSAPGRARGTGLACRHAAGSLWLEGGGPLRPLGASATAPPPAPSRGGVVALMKGLFVTPAAAPEGWIEDPQLGKQLALRDCSGAL
ncbi:hypothetical protein PAPYR_5238 [Paratrimastix pyriformis]|uniref:Uncharacterized protein n=1 Tax=Paratrimastix pyriformis TaxID=342808 RepID=A0ABQ8UI93_9EUKA|nr:hypothetical protein PAPYR_5238 [Paratrimastix pyriformis]